MNPIQSEFKIKDVIDSPFRNCMAHLKIEPSEVEFRGRKYTYTSYFYVCDESGIEFIDESLGDINTRQVYDQYRQEYDIPMVAELKEYRALYHYSTDDMDHLLGLSEGSYSKYELGEVPTLEVSQTLRVLKND